MSARHLLECSASVEGLGEQEDVVGEPLRPGPPAVVPLPPGTSLCSGWGGVPHLGQEESEMGFGPKGRLFM